MSKMLKKSFITLMIFLVLIISISSISASDNDSVNETLTTNDIEIEQVLENPMTEDVLSDEGDKTFTDLNTDISDKTEVTLESDYVYSQDTDTSYKNGITVNGELTINGNGKTLNPNGNLLFTIGNTGKLTLNDMTIVNSYTSPNAMIKNSGTLILNNVTYTVERHILSSFTSGSKFITIQNDGEMTVTNSLFKDSHIYSDAITSTSKSLYVYGLIYNTNKITIENTIFDNNKLSNPESDKIGRTIDICAILHNTNEMQLNNVTIQNSSVSYVPASNHHFEGIIFNEKGSLKINGSVIKNNTIFFPQNENTNLMGVIYNEATTAELTVSNSIITDNSHIQNKVIKEIIRNKGTATLNNNYWGSNSPDFSTLINGGTSPSNFVVLGFESEPVTVGEEKTFEITLNTVNTSGAISNLETGTLPNYNITVTSKKLGNTVVEIKNGVGQYKYLPLTGGEDTITLNGVEYPITINELPAGDFTELKNLIGENSEINLFKDYTYASTDSALQTGIPINKEITINGNGYTINSTDAARLFNVGTEGKLILNNVVLITDLVVTQTAPSNGNILNKGEIEFNEVTFTSNRIWKSGTVFAPAISNDGTLTIKNSEFIDSLAKYTGTTAIPYGLIHNKGTLNIYDSIFKNNTIYSSGTSMSGQTGLIYNAKILNMENTVFENNSITHDKDGNAMSTIYGIVYGGNSASEIYVNNCTFNENSVSTRSTNVNANTFGAICIRYGKITVTNSNFIKNTAITGAAIGMYMASNVNLISENNLFEDNTALKNGGAIYIYYASILTSANDKFINNNALNGGAIYGQTSTTNNANITVSNSIFEGNTATVGSSIYNTEKTTINNNYWGTNNPDFETLIKNESNSLTPENHIIITIDGAANILPESKGTYTVNFKTNDTNEVKELPDYKVDLTATNTLSDDSIVISKGSASFIYTSTLDEITDVIKASADSVEKASLTVTIQEDPNAKGTYKELERLIRKADGTLDLVKDYTFDSETDAGLENGIVIDKVLTINGHGFKINSTDLAKLFQITSAGSLTLNDVVLLSNYNATDTYNNVRKEASINNAGTLIFNNVTFTINQKATDAASTLASGIYNTKTMEINNSNFINSNIETNTQYCLGLIDNNGGTINIRNTVFDKNSAIESTSMSTCYFAGLINNMGTLTMSNVNVTNNYMKTPNTIRGLIRAYTGSKITIEDSIFENNTVESDKNSATGTVIYAETGSMTISNSKFIKNSGASSGGAIYATVAITFTNNTFEKNSASSMGGAVYCGSNTIFINNTFKENKAENGGAIYSSSYLQSSKTYYFTGNIFIENEATKNGGAVYASATGTPTSPVLDNIFKNNKADGKGGALYISGTAIRISNSIFKENTANEGAVIYVQTTGTTQSIIQNSIFDNNVANSPSGTLLYYPGASTIENNYWGTNTPDFEKIFAISKGTRTNPTSIALLTIEGKESITASNIYSLSFKDNNTGNIVELPDYTFNLTSNINKLEPASVVISKGESTFEYIVENRGADTISALLNNDVKATFDMSVVELTKTPVFSIVAEDVTYSDALNLTFTIAEGPQGSDIYQWTILDKNGEIVETGFINSETNEISYTKNYNAGNYTVKVSISNVDGWKNLTVSDTFEIKQKQSEINPTVKINDDNSVEITINIQENGETLNVAGNVNTIIDTDYGKAVEEGIATINTNVLTNGTYTVTLKYTGDTNYLGDEKTITITIKNIVKENSFDLTGSNSSNPTFSIELPEDAKGNLTVTIVDGDTKTKALENGYANITFDNLKPGNYTAIVTYTGDNNYNPITQETSVSVPKKEIPGGENALNMTTPEGSDSPSYSIKLPSDATGNLTVTVDGENYTKALENGSATVTVPKLAPGSHNITVTYTGDENYSSISKTTSITVPGTSAPVSEPAKDTQVSKPANAKKAASKIIAKKKTFKAKKKVKKYIITLKSGKKPIKMVKVTLKIKGKTYKAKTNAKGKATFKIKKLTKKGTYKAVIKFKGNKTYKAATKKVKIKIKK